jgi:hypothetical protein
VNELRELYADAPGFAKTAMENVINEIKSGAAGADQAPKTLRCSQPSRVNHLRFHEFSTFAQGSGLNRPISLHRIMPRCLPAHETLTGGRVVQSGSGD